MPRGNRIHPLLLTSLFLIFTGARVITAPPIVDKPRVLADTAAYDRISRGSMEQISFWAGSRPPVFPILLKIAQQDYDRAAAFQLGISIVAWTFLALMVSRRLRGVWLQGIGFALVLLFGLERHISGWDFVMLAESLSISTLAMFLAAGLWLTESWHPAKLLAFSFTAMLLALTRDTNAWMLLALAACIATAAALHWATAKSWIVAACLILVFLVSNASASMGERWVFPLGNLIAQRVLTNPSASSYFEMCGMPISPALLRLSGGFANSEDQAMFTDPELEDFRYWLRSNGRSCYVGWLLSDPVARLGETVQVAGGLITFSAVDRFFSNRYTPLLLPMVEGMLYPERFALWIWAYSTLAALIAIWKGWWRRDSLWVLVIFLIVLVLPHLFLTWHGDAMAPDRHALSAGVQLYLAFWLINLMMIQHIWTKLRGAY